MMTGTSGSQAPVEASLDVVVEGTIMGWARDPSRPDGIALLELRLGTRWVALFQADIFRPDLRDAGMGTGHHGFAVPIAADLWERARLQGEPFTVSSPAEPERVLFSIDNSERLDISEWLRPLFVRNLAVEDHPGGETVRWLSPSTPSYKALFSPEIPVVSQSAPGLFPYAEYVRHMANGGARYKPELIGPDLDHFFRWYLEGYGLERAPRRAPLSAAVIRWLNEPVVIGGQAHAPTRALLWSMAECASERGLDSLDDNGRFIALVYWWACERAPALNVEDCLVTPLQVELLRHVPERWAGQRFPLSHFMEQARSRRTTLARLGGMQGLSARVTAYMLLLIEAVAEPGLLRFVPRVVLDRLLHGDKPLFDELASDIFVERTGFRAMTARDYRRSLSEKGFDLDTLSFLSVDRSGDRCEAARLGSVPPEPPVDVQIVGPFGKASGLAQAARVSWAVLDATGLAISALTFELDNHQPDDGDARTAVTAVPARVNLIHVNADMLPLAYAYLPDLNQAAYTIGFFFWELDRPAKCHRLALDLVDEVWVATEYNRRCFAGWTEKPVINVGSALPPFAPPSHAEAIAARARYCRAGTDDFVVMTTFDSLSFALRKNPLGLVRAFRDAFPGDSGVRLLVKTHNAVTLDDGPGPKEWKEVLRLAALDDRVIVVDETMPFASVMALIAAADCYASLHRSEGLGFGMLEAMRLGVPVLSTAYSGNLDFCDDSTAWLVEAEEVAVPTGAYAYAEPGHRWAEPRHDAAVSALRALRSDATLRNARVEAARARVLERHSVEAAAKRYAARLDTIMATLPAPALQPSRRPAVGTRRLRLFS